jgi:hypothetical protein
MARSTHELSPDMVKASKGNRASKGKGAEPRVGLIGRKRSVGKRSDPAYQQITAYIKRTTHRNVKIKLLEEEQPKELSELIQELLSTWLAKR